MPSRFRTPAALLIACLAALTATPAQATLPGADGDILFDAFTGSSVRSLWKVGPAGLGLTELDPTDGRVFVPTPGGLLLRSERTNATDGTPEIVLTPPGGGPEQVIEHIPSDATLVAVAPDGDHFVAYGNESKLYLGTITGNAAPTLVTLSGDPHIRRLVAPVWTPDGTEVVGVHHDDDPYPRFYRIGAINPFTGVARQIDVMTHPDTTSSGTPRFGEAEFIAGETVDVSPDGTTIAFARRHERLNGCPAPHDTELCEVFTKSQIVTVPTAGGAETVLYDGLEGQRHLTPNPAFTTTPLDGEAVASGGISWSPSGTKIAFPWFLLDPGPIDNPQVVTAQIRTIDVATGHVTVLAAKSPPDWLSVGQIMWTRAPAPIIFVPGFLASKLRCGTRSLWLNLPSPKLGALELGADGTTAAGDGTCAGQGAIVTDGVVESAANKDVHGSTLAFLDRVAPGNAHYVYAWDWRKSPTQSLAGLDALVDQARAENGGAKVSILAHSYGGLLTRLYLDNQSRADKVGRALFAGTPSWGAPKIFFTLATGQETPVGRVGLDTFLKNDELKSLARNLAGAYTLYPSGHYGTWLTVEGRVPSVLDTDVKLTDYVNDDLLGNGPLLQQALDLHDNVLDGWKANGVDLRALVGTGMNTIVGVRLLPDAFTGDGDQAELRFGNGDETVPARSATQGTPGTSNPLGDDIPISYACGVSHVPLAGDAELTAANAAGFLQRGEDLTAPAQPCDNGGFSVELFDVNLTPATPPAGGAPRSALTRAAAGTPLATDVLAAEAAGDIDVIRFPGADIIVTDDRRPVHLNIPGATARMVVRRVDGETQGAAQTFIAADGGLVLDTTSAKSVAVTPFTPPVDPGGPEVPGTDGPGTDAPGTLVPGTLVPPKPTAKDRTAPKVTISVRRSHGRYLVTLRASDKGGVRGVQYRLSSKGVFRTYRSTLRLTRTQLTALRVRATDRAGNTSKLLAAKVPRGR